MTRTRAIAVGGRMIDREVERIALPVDLLAHAIGGLPRLTAAALIGVDLVDRALPGEAVREARRQTRVGACRMLRLCQRTLEADARNARYDWRPWVEAAIHDTVIRLDRGIPVDEPRHEVDAVQLADALARALGEASRALAYDRMALPEALCAGQTQALLLVVAAERQRLSASG